MTDVDVDSGSKLYPESTYAAGTPECALHGQSTGDHEDPAAQRRQAAQLSRLGGTVTEYVSTGVYLFPANAGYLVARASRAARAADPPVVC